MESKVKLGIDSKSMRKKATSTKPSSSAQSVENESVNSDKSSVKNAQTIAAAFSESPKSDIYTIDFSSNKKVNSDRMDEIIDPDEQDNFSTSTQSSTSVLNNVSMEPDSLENSKLEDSNDSLTDTIAQVASGSISSDTKKIIEDKQNEMIMKSKLKKEIIQIPGNVDEDSKNSKSPHLKRTNIQGDDDSSSATAAVDAAASSLLSTVSSKSNNKPKLAFLNHKNLSSKRKRLLTLKNKIEFLRAKKLKKNSEKDTEKGESQEPDEQNDHDPMRTCLICKLEMDQDVLNEHVMKHFYETAKCCSCTKVSSNPANFVVHILTHLPTESEESILKDRTNHPVRSKELLDELIDKAKLNKEELESLVQHIYLSDSLTANEEYKLLELDEDSLDYLLEGNSLIIRGCETDNAICCTKDSTFSFKVAEISNPLLITSNLSYLGKSEQTSSNSEVLLMTNSYFLMAKEKPKLQKIKNLLEYNLYCGKAYELTAQKYTINHFLNFIQASEKEVYKYLNFIQAFKIDNYWRLLDFKYLNQIMDNIVKMIEEKCWLFDKIPVTDICQELDSIYDISILIQFMYYYFSRNEDDPSYFSIKKEKIIHFYADSILRATVKMRFSEFQTILEKTLPNNFDLEFDIRLIQDLCYVDEPYVYYLNVLDMPDDLEKRFKYLFEKRKKWSQEELKAYIQDLCSNNAAEISNALTKYCRSYNQNGTKHFTSRL